MSSFDDVSSGVGTLALFSSSQRDTFESATMSDAADAKKIIDLLVEGSEGRLHIGDAVM